MFNFFKKKEKVEIAPEKTWREEEYEYLDKRKRVLGEYAYSKNFRGYKRCRISSSRYPEAEINLKKLIEQRPIIRAKDIYGLQSIDLTGTVITICLAKLKDGYDIIMVYIDGMFIGSNIPGDEGKTVAILKALKEHKVTSAHIEICFGNDPIDNSLAFSNYLMVNGVEW